MIRHCAVIKFLIPLKNTIYNKFFGRTIVNDQLYIYVLLNTIYVTMIETCSRKCMLLGTLCLGILTIAVLIIESHLAGSLPVHKYKNRTSPTENDSTCWKDQEYTILAECHPCTDFEIKSKSIGVCIHTHYKEVLRCKNGEHVTRSCDKVAHLEERAFWKFVLWTLFLSVTSCFAVMFRLQVLNRKAIRRAHQHLANGLS